MEPQVVLTLPLLEGTDGVQKMSKSLGNSIGVLEAPHEMFGKIMSISDDLMWRYYQLLSDRDEQEVQALRQKAEQGAMNPKEAKMGLAGELVARYHSQEWADQARQEFDSVFKNKNIPKDIPTLETWGADPKWICKVMAEADLSSSTSDARRLVRQGAVSLDGEKITDENFQLNGNQAYLIKVGKKRFLQITTD